MTSRHQLMPNSKEQNPSLEANSSSASEGNPRILWKEETLYFLDKCPPLVPVISQNNEIYAFLIFILILSYHIILGLLRCLFAIGFTTKTPVRNFLLPHKGHMPCAPNCPWFSHLVIIGEEHQSWTFPYAIFSFLCFLSPSYDQTSIWSPDSRTPSAYLQFEQTVISNTIITNNML